MTPEPSPKSKTAASSRLSLPTIKLGCENLGSFDVKILSKTLGDILHPQPAPWLYCVSFISIILLAFQKIY